MSSPSGEDSCDENWGEEDAVVAKSNIHSRTNSIDPSSNDNNNNVDSRALRYGEGGGWYDTSPAARRQKFAFYVCIIIVYFVQGLIGLADLSQMWFFKEYLGLNPAHTASLLGLRSVAWIIKPLYGLISDSIPIFGYRRRSWLAISGILGFLGWQAMAAIITSAGAATLSLIVASISVAFSDVIVDALVVEKVQRNPEVGTWLQMVCWLSRAVGAIITSFLGGVLLNYVTARMVFFITSFMPLLILIISPLIGEQKEVLDKSVSMNVLHKLRQCATAISVHSLWKPLLFIFVFCGTPGTSVVFFYFKKERLKFDSTFLGLLDAIEHLANFVGIVFFYVFLRSLHFRTIFFLATLGRVFSFFQLLLLMRTNQAIGISDRSWVVITSMCTFLINGVGLIAKVVLAARICPPGVEGTLFALIMSVMNFAVMFGTESGAFLSRLCGLDATHFGNLWMVFTICQIFGLFPLMLLCLLPKIQAQPSRVGDGDDL